MMKVLILLLLLLCSGSLLYTASGCVELHVCYESHRHRFCCHYDSDLSKALENVLKHAYKEDKDGWINVNVTINVTCDCNLSELINITHTMERVPPHHGKLHIIGNYYTVSCAGEYSLILNSRSFASSQLIITNIIFDNCHSSNADYLPAAFAFVNFDSVTLDSVTFNDTQGVLIDAISNEVSIKNCVFTNSRLITPALMVGLEWSLLYLEGNQFTNLHVSAAGSGVIAIEMKGRGYCNNLKIDISDCDFTNNTISYPVYNAGVQVNVFGRTNADVSISNCRFNNTIGPFYSLLSLESHQAIWTGTVTLDTNHFKANDGNGVLYIDVTSTWVNFKHFNNFFINNTGAVLTVGGTASHNFSNLKIQDSKIASSDAVSTPPVYIVCRYCQESHRPSISFNQVNISLNNAPSSLPIVHVEQVDMLISDSQFSSNHKTALHVKNSNTNFSGEVLFSDNRNGYLGGGMSLYGHSNLIFESDCSVSFNSNSAEYGGAVFIESNISLHTLCSFSNYTSMANNLATVSGNDVYFQNADQVLQYIDELPHDDSCSPAVRTLIQEAGTPPVNLTSHSEQDEITLFPGQLIALNLSVKDVNNQSVYCDSFASLRHYDDAPGTSSEVHLMGLHRLQLTTDKIFTELYLSTSKEPPLDLNTSLQLVLSCDAFNISIDLNIADCPIGFLYSNGVCNCVNISGVLCSKKYGQVCIERGKWLGKVDDETKLAGCQSPYCNVSYTQCPFETQDQDMYILLSDSDHQCLHNRGGISCTQCATGYCFSYEAVHCVSDCSNPGAIAVFIFVLLFQVLLSIMLLFVLRGTIKTGAGSLYGPLFYLAVLKLMPFASFSAYSGLNDIITIVVSYVFIDMEMFGLLPVSSFPYMGHLSHTVFHFVGPIVTAIVLLLVITVVWYIPYFRSHYQHLSLWHAVALLILLCYWNFISTGLAIMSRITINGSAKVALQPELTYFTSEHVPLWLLSFALIVFVFFPLVVLLVSSKFLSRRFKLTRLKLFLYFYQGCYADRYYWYPAVYFVAFFVIALSEHSPLVQQIVLLTLLTLQFVLNPYHLKWMNVSDAMLLLNLFFVSSLLYQQVKAGDADVASTVFVYLFVLISILYFIVGGLAVLLYQLGVFNKIDKRTSIFNKLISFQEKFATQQLGSHFDIEGSSKCESMNEPAIIDGATTGYREPLLNLMSENESSGTYGIN